VTSLPEHEAAILFADLSGFTALTEAHGDLDAAEVAGRFHELAEVALQGGTRLIKTIGDAVMTASPTSPAALATALELARLVEATPRFPTIRIGIDAGPVVERGRDLFGATVNIAARTAAHARAGQILCTRRVSEQLHDCPQVRRVAIGPVTFKNVADAVELIELVPQALVIEQAIDPVCRMTVDPARAAETMIVGGRSIFFCSTTCAELFRTRASRSP
jgi:class 3 adenylate cyclase/YHS domain-containing protein